MHGVREFSENSDEIGLPVMRKYAGIFCGGGDFCKEKAIVAVKKLNEKNGAVRDFAILENVSPSGEFTDSP